MLIYPKQPSCNHGHHLFSIILTAIDFLSHILVHFKSPFSLRILPLAHFLTPLLFKLPFCLPIHLPVSSTSDPLPSVFIRCSINSPTLMERAIPDFSSCNSVDEWLDTIKMSRYKEHFAAGGYHTLGHVISMNQG